ncbi:MAG TPA: DUF6351 family protein, partial [Nocardioides sp.]|nr:DUF6351 family protein [Nocardioides sp.]
MLARPLLLALLTALPLVVGTLPAGQASAAGPLTIRVLSNRADLVSGGDALVAVGLPDGVSAADVRVSVGERDVTDAFAVRPNGKFEGLVEGLAEGANQLQAEAGGVVVTTTVTNHPNGGPIFSGPHHEPYQCPAGAVDAKCNQPVEYTLLYKSTDPTQPDLQPYDPDNPPDDVATTTTDEGKTVPFIVRREDGFQDRDRYAILTLWQQGQDWQPWAPQEQWNHKVLITHGGNCGASYAPGSPPLQDYSGTLESVPGVTPSYVTALGKGFAVVSTALANTGHNCNVSIEAESLMMAKERLVEQYGEIRYTI